MNDIAVWLNQLGLGKYAAVFVDNEIDAAILPRITEEDLKDLGLPIGARRKLQAAIEDLSVEAPDVPGLRSDSDGHAGSGDAERRQLTVMFADLVGSTELAQELDPEDLRDVNRAYQDVAKAAVEAYDGYVARYMGDGILAYFGYPRAHEDDAERAVRAGLRLVETVPTAVPERSLAVRVGIATGAVGVGNLIGEGASQESAVVGETPNLAARLQGMAEPGTLVIASTTRRLLRDLFELKDLGTHRVKGFSDPLQSWRVLGEGRAQSRFEALHGQRLSALVGREHELGLVTDRWERAVDGEGQVVLISGEPGIGKSRLVRASCDHAAGEPHVLLGHYCSVYHTTSALHPIVVALERAAGFTRDDSAQVRLDKLAASLAIADEALVEAVPLLSALLGISAGERHATLPLDPAHRRQRTLEVLLDQLEGLCAEQPVLAVYEDLHWADPTTLDLLELLVERAQSLPVLALLTFRPEFVPSWTGRAHVMHLPLSRLTRRHGRALVSEVTERTHLPGKVVDQIIAKTEGVPLFIEELTKTVLESAPGRGASRHGTGTGAGAELAIPETLQDSLMARLDHLTPASRELAQIGALIGREFGFDLLAGVAGRPARELETGLEPLVDSGLVHQRGKGSAATYLFKHALVRDVAYDSLLRTQREKLHAQTAVFLEEHSPEKVSNEPEVLAQHFAAGANPERAAEYWRRAGMRGLGRSSHQEAVESFGNALALLAALPRQQGNLEQAVDVRFELRAALIIVSPDRVPELIDEAETLADELGDDLRKGWACQYAMVSHALHGDHRRAVDAGARALSLGDATDDVGLQAVTCANMAFVYLVHSDFHDAKPFVDRSLDLLQAGLMYEREKFRMNHTPSVAVLTRRAWIHSESGDFSEAIADCEAGIQIAEEVRHPSSLMEAYAGLGRVYLTRGDPDKLNPLILAVERFEYVYRQPTYFHMVAEFLGSAYAMCGRVADAVDLLEEAIDQSAATKLLARHARNLVALGEAYLLANRPREAVDCARRALARSRTCKEEGNQAYGHRLLGNLAMAGERTDDAGAQSHIEQALKIAQSQNMRPFAAHCHLDLASVHVDSGAMCAAREELATAVDLFRSMTMPLGLARARTLARCVEGRSAP